MWQLARRLALSTLTIALLGGPSFGADAKDQGKHGAPGDRRIDRALHYDLFVTAGNTISDASGKKHHGTLIGGSLIEGRRRNSVQLDGAGRIEVTGAVDTLDPKGRPLTVGAVCKPEKPDGVIAAMGDSETGLSLFLKGGVPHFAVRIKGRLTTVADTEPVPLDEWCHLMGGIDRDGKIRIVVNGAAAPGVQAGFLPSRPPGPFCVGADPGPPVGDYSAPLCWNGQLQEVRLYWGFIDPKHDREELKDWADLSGCGCK